MRKYLLILILSILPLIANSQVRTWHKFQFSYEKNRIITNFEANLRAQDFLSKYNYFDLKLSAGMKVDKLNILVGIGYFDTHLQALNDTFFHTKEFRFWPQVRLREKIYFINYSQEFRYEFRFKEGEYTNRMRYKIEFSAPILSKPVVSAQISDELFLGFKPTYFQRNRFFTGIVIKLSKIQIALEYGNELNYSLANQKIYRLIQTTVKYKL